ALTLTHTQKLPRHLQGAGCHGDRHLATEMCEGSPAGFCSPSTQPHDQSHLLHSEQGAQHSTEGTNRRSEQRQSKKERQPETDTETETARETETERERERERARETERERERQRQRDRDRDSRSL